MLVKNSRRQEFKNSRIANKEKIISFIAYVMIFKNQEFKNSRFQEFKNLRFNSLDQTAPRPPRMAWEAHVRPPRRRPGPLVGPGLYRHPGRHLVSCRGWLRHPRHGVGGGL